MAQNQQPTIWGLGITFPIIAITSVALRFQARRIKGQKLESDDWTILLALIFSIGVTIDILIMTQQGGLGTHQLYDDDGYPLDPESVVIFGKTTYALEILTWPTVGLTKISVFLMYKRIFTTSRFRTMTWVLVGIITIWTIVFTFALMFSRMPIVAQWNYKIESTHVNQGALSTTALATDVATDFTILFLPIYKVWLLQMPFTRKALVICIFFLGGLVSVVGIIRIHFLTQIYSVPEESAEIDGSWIYTQIFYWTIIETHVGVLSACLPTLRPIQEQIALRFSFSKLRGSAGRLLSSSNGRASEARNRSMEEGLTLGNIEISHTTKEPRAPHHF